MDQRSIERQLRRWHRNGKSSRDNLSGQMGSDNPSTEHRHSATTGSGLSVEGQVRKEWDPTLGRGLPVFFYRTDGLD